MIITATEFRTNFGKYINLLSSEEIIITKRGKRIGRITREPSSKLDALDSISGIISEKDLESNYKDARLSRK